MTNLNTQWYLFMFVTLRIVLCPNADKDGNLE